LQRLCRVSGGPDPRRWRVRGPAGAEVDAFEAALQAALAAATADDVDGVLALEAAFDRLAQALKGGQ